MRLTNRTWSSDFRRAIAKSDSFRAPADLAGCQFACIGDSHMNGIDSIPTATAFASLFGGVWVNLGVNGNRTDQIAARIGSLRDNLVSFAVINGGINDLSQLYSLENFISSWRRILDYCAAEDMGVIALQMFPAAAYASGLHAERVRWNKQLEWLCEGYPNVICPNSDRLLGLDRAGLPAGNLYNVQASFDLDTYHLNNAGTATLVSYLATLELPFPHFHLTRIESLLGVSRSTCAAPTMTPNGGTVSVGSAVTLSTATQGALIRYTTDGSTPTPTHGELYLPGAKPTILSPQTIKAIAFRPFANPSSSTSKTFAFVAESSVTITPDLEVFEGQNAMMTVTGGSTYLWQYSDNNGVSWNTATGTNNTSTYTLASTVRSTHNGRQYRCQVDSVPSPVCTLTVWSPAALAPHVWIDADSSQLFVERTSPATPAVDTGPIGTVYDISGHNRHLAAPTDAARPILLTNEVNGRHAIRFQGTDDVLKASVASDWTFLHNGTDYTIAAVAKLGLVADPEALNVLCATRTSGATPGMWFGHETRNATGSNRLSASVSTGAGTVVSNLTSAETVPANTHCVVILRNDPDHASLALRSRIYVNGDEGVAHNAMAVAPATGNSANALNLGAGVNAAGTLEFPLSGDVCEFLIVNGAISDADRLRLRDWLAYRWGIAMAPSAHVGILSDEEGYRNKAAGLVITHNAPTLHPNSPIYQPGARNPGTVDCLYPVVYHDGSQYVLITMSYADASTAYVTRAISADGLNWTEPNLGLVNVGGNTNNCVLDFGGFVATSAFVFRELVSGKWLASCDEIGGSVADLYLFESADGLTWTQAQDNSSIPGEYAEARPLLRKADGRWLQSYTRGHAAAPNGDREIGFLLAPESGYTGTWTNLSPLILTSSNTDQKYAPAFERHGRGWLMAMSAYNDTAGAGYPMDGDLYWFRADGIATKIKDAAFPLGAPGSWHDSMVMPTSIITVGNETRIYGSGSPEHHQVFPRGSKIGLWTIGKRRWTQISGTGTVETPAFRANAASLTVNCDAASGSIRVEVLDNATGQIMTGYSAAQSTSLASNTYSGAVTWGASNLPTDREIRLRFVLDNATLYSWTAGTE